MNLLLDLSRLTAQTVVAGLWQGLALTLAVAVLLRLLPSLGPKVRSGVWTLTFAVAAILPFLRLPASEQQSSSPMHVEVGWAIGIVAIWFIVSSVRLGQLTAQAIRLRRIWRNATPVQVAAPIQAVLQASGRIPRLCTSHDVDAPSVLGFLAPRLLIPEYLYLALTQAELRQIVLHECEHLRRRDDWINLAQKFALALFPLNLALLFADRRVSLERELACDAEVVTATAAPLDYAANLTRLAERRLVRRTGLTLALSAWRCQSELGRRVHRILRPTRAMAASPMRAALALLTLAVAGGTVELARTPNLVSFSAAAATPTAEAVLPLKSSDHVRALPVVFHQPPILHVERTRKETTRHLAKPQMVSVEIVSRARQSQRRLILTAAQHPRDLAPAAHIVWTEFSPTYAAVPFADGWLILQL